MNYYKKRKNYYRHRSEIVEILNEITYSIIELVVFISMEYRKAKGLPPFPHPKRKNIKSRPRPYSPITC